MFMMISLMQGICMNFLMNVVYPTGYNITNIANRKTQPYGNTGSHRLLGKQIF